MQFMTLEDSTTSPWTTIAGADEETGEPFDYQLRTVSQGQHVRFETR